MAGGTLNLASNQGTGDDILSINPQITFFKKVYKRHTNFSVDYEKFFMDSDAEFGKPNRIFIPKKGDLVKNIYLHLELPKLTPT